MKINALSNLVAAFSDKYVQTTTDQKETQSTDTESQTEANEAAKVDSSFGSSEAEASARADKVERLKQAVADGTYKADSREVGMAFLKELTLM